MADSKKIGFGLVGLAVLGFVAFVLLQGQPSDEEQIKQALRDSIQAGKEGRAGSMLDLLSRNFTVDGQEIGSTRDVAKYIRDSKPDVAIDNWQPVVNGDRAQLDTSVSIQLGIPFNTTINLPKVHLTFAKESAPRWLIFPGSKWRLRRAATETNSIQDLMSGL